MPYPWCVQESPVMHTHGLAVLGKEMANQVTKRAWTAQVEQRSGQVGGQYPGGVGSNHGQKPTG